MSTLPSATGTRLPRQLLGNTRPVKPGTGTGTLTRLALAMTLFEGRGIAVLGRQFMTVEAMSLAALVMTATVTPHIGDVGRLSVIAQILDVVVVGVAVVVTHHEAIRARADERFGDKVMNLADFTWCVSRPSWWRSRVAGPTQGHLPITGRMVAGTATQALGHRNALDGQTASRVEQVRGFHLSLIRYLIAGMPGYWTPNFSGHTRDITRKVMAL